MPREEGKVGPPALKLCTCALHQIVLGNVERGMRGLSKAAKVKSTPLFDLLEDDVWVTASEDWFKAHLRHVAVRSPPAWGFSVVTDADLIQAWLATAALDGREILDPEAREGVERRSLRHLTLVDIAVPPTLLIIRLGVKSARNVAMPEVLLEAIKLRAHEGVPTWVWDQSDAPLDRDDHRCYAPFILDVVSGWHRLQESDWEHKEEKREVMQQRVTPTVTVRDALLGRPVRAPQLPPDEAPPEQEEVPEPDESTGDSALDQMLARPSREKKHKKQGFSGGKKGGGFGR